jgi:DNA helicase HerA-like ATPase
VASRHLAILATTGSGKSNLLALIAKGIADMYGTMLILDYQGEYSELRIKNVVNLQAKVNPRLLDAERLADMLDVRQGAEIQRTVLNQAMTQQVKDAEDFWGSLVASLNNIRDSEGSSAGTRNAAVRLVEIIERARRRKGRVLDPTIGNPIDMVAPNHINVLGMQDLSEMQAAFVISYYLEEVFERRKEARYARSAGGEGADRIKFRSPVVIAIEEAHTFLPGGEEKTDASRMAFKIAREGRKFGVGLIVISQRPSRVDQDVLSQMGSLAVSRITQPKDQNYILESSELVTEKLVSYLPSLNVGETVLLGQWVTLPSVVRVRKVDEKLVGADINAEREWREDLEMQGIARESTDDLIRRPD